MSTKVCFHTRYKLWKNKWGLVNLLFPGHAIGRLLIKMDIQHVKICKLTIDTIRKHPKVLNRDTKYIMGVGVIAIARIKKNQLYINRR